MECWDAPFCQNTYTLATQGAQRWFHFPSGVHLGRGSASQPWGCFHCSWVWRVFSTWAAVPLFLKEFKLIVGACASSVYLQLVKRKVLSPLSLETALQLPRRRSDRNTPLCRIRFRVLTGPAWSVISDDTFPHPPSPPPSSTGEDLGWVGRRYGLTRAALTLPKKK